MRMKANNIAFLSNIYCITKWQLVNEEESDIIPNNDKITYGIL